MKVTLYARISTEGQDADDKVSINEQLNAMRELCARNGWTPLKEFVDSKDYEASQNPKKGRIVNPSGERADRPALLEMLELVKSGQVDGILCWRDDRLVRHPRVAVALEDALDVGDVGRNGRGKVQIYDATGAAIDRFTLGIKAAIWKEENNRRKERFAMGKIGTLKQGRWPGTYLRLGYDMMKEEGKRGCKIVLADEEEVQAVKHIFQLADEGETLREIRRKLIAAEVRQKRGGRRHEWTPNLIRRILRCRDYLGQATWVFSDNKSWSIEIPRIIDAEQFKRVQKHLDNNKAKARRNTKGIYLLQYLLICGECGSKMCIHMNRFYYRVLVDGTRKRYTRKSPIHTYYCQTASVYRGEGHPEPSSWRGTKLESAVWKFIVDNAIRQPDLVIEQVQNRQAELRAQGDSMNGDIAKARQRLAEVEQQRAFYQRQAARNRISEAEFDERMDETDETLLYWQEEIDRLMELRDNANKTQAGMDYARRLLTGLQARLPEINQTPEELKALSKDEQAAILEERREIIRGLCDKIIIYGNGKIDIEGLLGEGKVSSFAVLGKELSSTITPFQIRDTTIALQYYPDRIL